MSRMKNIFIAILLLAVPVGLCLAQSAPGVSGEWDFTMTTPRGEMTSTAKFVQDGEKITVTMTNPRGESTGEGTLKGADIEWTITREGPNGPSTLTYKGTVEGDTMKGQAQMGDRGAMDWKATRKAA